MKTLLLLVISTFLYAETSDTPPKLRGFIEANIGTKNFFKGQNGDKSEITVKKEKEWSYYSFDLYKTIGMSLGISINKDKPTKNLTLDGQGYILQILPENTISESSGSKKSTVVFLFRKIK